MLWVPTSPPPHLQNLHTYIKAYIFKRHLSPHHHDAKVNSLPISSQKGDNLYKELLISHGLKYWQRLALLSQVVFALTMTMINPR